MKISLRVGFSLAFAAALGLCWWLWYQQRRLSQDAEQRLGALGSDKARLTREGAALQHDYDALRQQLSERGIEPALPRPSTSRLEEAQRLEAVRQLAQVQTKLAAANTSITELQNRVQDLQTAEEKLAADNKRLTASESDLKDDLDSTRRVVQAMETELKTKSDRLAQMEVQLRKARDEQKVLQQKIGQSGTLLNDLFEINRRRENTVSNLQRRFRDMTDQLRGLTVRLDRERDNPAAAAPDISRLQTAVQSSEDDLRQLAGLNSQAQRLSRELSQK